MHPKNMEYMFQLPEANVVIPVVVTFRDIDKCFHKMLEQIKLRHYLRIYAMIYLDVLLLAYTTCAIFREDYDSTYKWMPIYYNYGCTSKHENNNNRFRFVEEKEEIEFNFCDKLWERAIIPYKTEFTNGDSLMITSLRKIERGIGALCINKSSLPHLCEENIFLYQWEGRLYIRSYLSVNHFKKFINDKTGYRVFKTCVKLNSTTS